MIVFHVPALRTSCTSLATRAVEEEALASRNDSIALVSAPRRGLASVRLEALKHRQLRSAEVHRLRPGWEWTGQGWRAPCIALPFHAAPAGALDLNAVPAPAASPSTANPNDDDDSDDDATAIREAQARAKAAQAATDAPAAAGGAE